MTITLNDMTALAKSLLSSIELVELAEKNLKFAKEKARTLKEEAIPTAMQELGITKIVLDSGQTLSMKQEVYASISAANKVKAFEWLQVHGFGGLIKVEVKANFTKGQHDNAKKLYEELSLRNIHAEFKEFVAPQTLKAFLREQIADGNAVPLDLFGAHPVMTATIK